MSEKTQEFIDAYGDQAYHAAAICTTIATRMSDRDGAEMFAACAKELMELGYHKHPKTIGAAK